MIDLEKAKQEFENYVNTYDLSNKKILRKKGHSYRVMQKSEEIARSLNLDEEEVNLATLIGLLHDIARFEEAKRYNAFSKHDEFDHGDMGVKILEDGNFIRKFIETDKYDYIIKKAIKNHNKFEIEEGLDEQTLMHCRIIRDADKLDIFVEALDLFWIKSKEGVETTNITESYYNQFMERSSICRIPNQSMVDEVVIWLAFIFDLNFKYSFEEVRREKYVDRIINEFDFKVEDTNQKMKKMKENIENFMNEKIEE